MHTIFDVVLSSRHGLGDISVSVDPFTGKTCKYVPVITRYPNGPLITKDDFLRSVQAQIIKGKVSAAIDPRLAIVEDLFNPGVAHHDGKFLLMMRFQNTANFNDVYLAESLDGIHWEHNPKVLSLPDLPPTPKAETLEIACPDLPSDQEWHPGVFYDPRITQMESGEYLITLAVDYDTIEPSGRHYVNVCDNVLYCTRDFESFEYVSVFAGSSRNGVIFPRQIDGFYYNAGRPNSYKRPGEPATGQNIILYRSKDLIEWEQVSVLFSGGHSWMGYGGPGFPPFETEKYWVLGVHGVEVHGTHRVHYRGGVCLIDKQSMEIVGKPIPILNPQEPYELTGLVDNVVFPTGLLFSDACGYGVKKPDTKIAVYYGGADHVIHAGLTTVGRLVDAALGRYDPFL